MQQGILVSSVHAEQGTQKEQARQDHSLPLAPTVEPLEGSSGNN